MTNQHDQSPATGLPPGVHNPDQPCPCTDRGPAAAQTGVVLVGRRAGVAVLLVRAEQGKVRLHQVPVGGRRAEARLEPGDLGASQWKLMLISEPATRRHERASGKCAQHVQYPVPSRACKHAHWHTWLQHPLTSHNPNVPGQSRSRRSWRCKRHWGQAECRRRWSCSSQPRC